MFDSQAQRTRHRTWSWKSKSNIFQFIRNDELTTLVILCHNLPKSNFRWWEPLNGMVLATGWSQINNLIFYSTLPSLRFELFESNKMLLRDIEVANIILFRVNWWLLVIELRNGWTSAQNLKISINFGTN